MTLDRRMADEARLRAKAEKMARSRWIDTEADPRASGKIYSTHGKSCSCSACGNPRRHFKDTTLSEKKSNLSKFENNGND